MHPILATRANLIAYILSWLFVGAVCAGLTMTVGSGLVHSLTFGLLSAVFASIFFLPAYYPCLALKPEKTGPTIFLTSVALIAAVFGLVWASAMFLTHHLSSRVGHVPFQKHNFAILTAIGWIICVITVAVYYVYIAHARAREAEKHEQELLVMARDAELRALRAQLNPHFLFNSLNSISALTTLDPKRAREMCVLLSDFFRKGLRLGERLAVPLSEELDLLKNYFAIEQIRFGQRLGVVWEIDDAALSAEIPTLLLQPLVENAVKHGVSKLIEGGTVRIIASARRGNIFITLENPVDVEETSSRGRTPKGKEREVPIGLGLGIKQVHQRLVTRFGAEGRMEVETVGGMYRVRLFFPMIRKEAHHE
jgi:sensor histidine kinase YesM